jgi:hypothetical protein
VSFLRHSIASQWRAIADARALPVTWQFLVLWMIFSDGVFIIGTIGALFANSEVDWGCFPRGMGILLMFLLVPLCAMAGNVAYLKVATRWGIPSKTMLLASLFCCAVIPAYGLLGLVSTRIGIRHGWEVLSVCVWYGLHLGAMQSYARGTFAVLVPRGKESALFSLYELTNRGSSALGPLVLTLIQATTGNLRLGFIFVLLSIIGPALLLVRLDIAAGGKAAAAAGQQHEREQRQKRLIDAGRMPGGADSEGGSCASTSVIVAPNPTFRGGTGGADEGPFGLRSPLSDLGVGSLVSGSSAYSLPVASPAASPAARQLPTLASSLTMALQSPDPRGRAVELVVVAQPSAAGDFGPRGSGTVRPHLHVAASEFALRAPGPAFTDAPEEPAHSGSSALGSVESSASSGAYTHATGLRTDVEVPWGAAHRPSAGDGGSLMATLQPPWENRADADASGGVHGGHNPAAVGHAVASFSANTQRDASFGSELSELHRGDPRCA